MRRLTLEHSHPRAARTNGTTSQQSRRDRERSVSPDQGQGCRRALARRAKPYPNLEPPASPLTRGDPTPRLLRSRFTILARDGKCHRASEQQKDNLPCPLQSQMPLMNHVMEDASVAVPKRPRVVRALVTEQAANIECEGILRQP